MTVNLIETYTIGIQTAVKPTQQSNRWMDNNEVYQQNYQTKDKNKALL